MIYVYCPRASEGAFALAKALGASRLRRFDGMDFWNKNIRYVPEEGSVIVCWGANLPEMEDIRVLNSLDMPMNKYQEWEVLVKAGVRSPRFVKGDTYHSTAYYRENGYIPRSYYHQGGLDILTPGGTRVDFFVQKETFLKEVRIHSFDGRSIRAGEKIPIEGFTPCNESDWKINSRMLHPWVRSWDGGWKISYNGFTSTATMREMAHKAVKALGLTFGAVDLAQRADGTFVVLEVNTSPGIEGNTLNTYARAITRWIAKEPQEGV